MRPVEFIIKEGDEHLTSHSGLALIGALMKRMELRPRIKGRLPSDLFGVEQSPPAESGMCP